MSVRNTVLTPPTNSLLELQVGIIIACMPAMSQSMRRLSPLYDRLRSTLAHYYHISISSTARSKESKSKKDTLAGVIELYDGNGASDNPTSKDFYETSMTVPARTLRPKNNHESQADAETDTSHLMNGTRWYK